MLSRIRRYFKSRPLVKNMVAYGGLFVGAELTQQTLRKRIWKDDVDPRYNMDAFARYTFFGGLWYPVIYHHWYRWLDSRFVGTTLAMVTIKSLIDQFVMEPPLLASFYIGMSILEGEEDIFAECKKKYIPTFMSGCIFWLPAMALNFWLMPDSMRVIFLGICTFVWCNFICWYKRQ